MEQHTIYMRRCIELAAKGGGHVHPNPLVGALVEYEGAIIGEGFHEVFGGPHAEVNAIRSVKNTELLGKATLYVTLEPCCHFGQTPPCTSLIISSGIKKVVIGNTDPNPLMNGKGIELLKKTGVNVISGVLESECWNVNRRFMTFHQKKRPYIVLKWAESSNGIMGDSTMVLKVSNDTSRKLVHRWRTEEHGILIGYNTALLDDPLLDARLWGKPDPVRIIIDPELSLPATLNVFRSGSRVIVLNTRKSGKKGHIEYCRFAESPDSVSQILSLLYSNGIVSVLVEGGKNTLECFLKANAWDECRVFRSSTILQGSISSPEFQMAADSMETINGDLLSIYHNITADHV